jgi:hypothetical protein
MLSATENAPKNVEELRELLQHDTKVKVASMSFPIVGRSHRGIGLAVVWLGCTARTEIAVQCQVHASLYKGAMRKT